MFRGAVVRDTVNWRTETERERTTTTTRSHADNVTSSSLRGGWRRRGPITRHHRDSAKTPSSSSPHDIRQRRREFKCCILSVLGPRPGPVDSRTFVSDETHCCFVVRIVCQNAETVPFCSVLVFFFSHNLSLVPSWNSRIWVSIAAENRANVWVSIAVSVILWILFKNRDIEPFRKIPLSAVAKVPIPNDYIGRLFDYR